MRLENSLSFILRGDVLLCGLPEHEDYDFETDCSIADEAFDEYQYENVYDDAGEEFYREFSRDSRAFLMRAKRDDDGDMEQEENLPPKNLFDLDDDDDDDYDDHDDDVDDDDDYDDDDDDDDSDEDDDDAAYDAEVEEGEFSGTSFYFQLADHLPSPPEKEKEDEDEDEVISESKSRSSAHTDLESLSHTSSLSPIHYEKTVVENPIRNISSVSDEVCSTPSLKDILNEKNDVVPRAEDVCSTPSLQTPSLKKKIDVVGFEMFEDMVPRSSLRKKKNAALSMTQQNNNENCHPNHHTPATAVKSSKKSTLKKKVQMQVPRTPDIWTSSQFDTPLNKGSKPVVCHTVHAVTTGFEIFEDTVLRSLDRKTMTDENMNTIQRARKNLRKPKEKVLSPSVNRINEVMVSLAKLKKSVVKLETKNDVATIETLIDYWEELGTPPAAEPEKDRSTRTSSKSGSTPTEKGMQKRHRKKKNIDDNNQVVTEEDEAILDIAAGASKSPCAESASLPRSPSMTTVTSSSFLANGSSAQEVRCVIKRDKATVQGAFFPRFFLLGEQSSEVLVMAKKLNVYQRNASYHFFDMTMSCRRNQKFTKSSPNYLGKLRPMSNDRTEYELILADKGGKGDKSSKNQNKQQLVRISIDKYGASSNGKGGES